MAAQTNSIGIDETQWPHESVPHIFDKYIKDKKQDTFDVAAEIDEVFKDIGIQFDVDDYEDLLKDAKQNLSSDMFVPRKEFEDLLCEWIMLFKEEVSSTLLTECLDIIQVKYRDSSEELENVLKNVAGGNKSEISIEQLPQFIQEAIPILEVRIVDLKTKKPKSDENVCDDKQEQNFYNDIIAQAKKNNYKTVNLQDTEKILIDYFKGVDAQYSFVLLKHYDSELGIDPYQDLDENNNLFSANRKKDRQEDDDYIEETEYQIQVAESEGNNVKAEKYRQIKQFIKMRKEMSSQQDRTSVEIMIEKVKKEIEDLETDDKQNPNDKSGKSYGNKILQPPSREQRYDDEQLDDEGNFGEYNQDAAMYDSDGNYYGDQMKNPNNRNSPSPYPNDGQAYKQESYRNGSKMKSNNSPIKGESRFSQGEQLEIEKRLDDEPHESLDEKRKRGIKEIFDFYTRQHLMIGKKATFDQIQYELSNMNMGEFMKFCKDFNIPVSKTRCAEIFKKTAKNSKEMFLEHFNESFHKLIEMRNKEELENLDKRLKEVKKLILKRKKKLEIDDSSNKDEEDGENQGLTLKQLAEKADGKLDMLKDTLEQKVDDSINHEENKTPTGTRDSQIINSQKSGNSKAKGGDPHGAIARMQDKELEEIRQRNAEEAKKVILYELIFRIR